MGRHYNEGRDIVGNIPPGYNIKLMALDKDGKAHMIVTRSSINRVCDKELNR